MGDPEVVNNAATVNPLGASTGKEQPVLVGGEVGTTGASGAVDVWPEIAWFPPGIGEAGALGDPDIFDLAESPRVVGREIEGQSVVRNRRVIVVGRRINARAEVHGRRPLRERPEWMLPTAVGFRPLWASGDDAGPREQRHGGDA